MVKKGKVDKALKTTLGQYIYSTMIQLNEDHVGSKIDFPMKILRPINPKMDSRIYINTSNGRKAYEFISLYVSKCLERNLAYNMKFLLTSLRTRTDKTVLYISNEVLNEHIDILHDIKRERPDLVEAFGTPLATGHVEDYFTVCKNYSLTYNLFFDTLSFESFYITFSKLILEKQKSKLTSEQIEDLQKNYSKQAFHKTNLTQCEGLHVLTESKKNLTKFLKEYKPFVLELLAENKSEIVEKFRETLKRCSSFAEFGDFEHTDFPVCFPKIFIESFEVEIDKTLPTKPVTTAKTENKPVHNQTKRKTLSIHDVDVLLNSEEPSTLRVQAVLAGIPQKSTETLSNNQIRQKIFEKIPLDDTAIVEILCSDTSRLQKCLVAFGFSSYEVEKQDRETLEGMFIRKVGLDKAIEADKLAVNTQKNNRSKTQPHLWQHSSSNASCQREKHIRGFGICKKSRGQTTCFEIAFSIISRRRIRLCQQNGIAQKFQ